MELGELDFRGRNASVAAEIVRWPQPESLQGAPVTQAKAKTPEPKRPSITSALSYDVYRAACPTRRVLDLVADKWTALIIGLLADRPHLFGELRSAIEGISAKVLAQKLRLLEADGLVHRRVLPTRRVTVEYSLTGLGQTLIGPLEAIRDWAEQHIEEIRQANLQSGKPSGGRR
jgi:DNA-binding HxlR family transcriptional regulator